MKLGKAILILVVILLGATTSGSALAGGGHSGGGHFGGGHSGGSHFGGGHSGGSHFGGGHFGGRHFGGDRFGVFIGDPFFFPGYYGPLAYYSAPVIAAPSSPPVYIEQGAQPAPREEPYYWYHCSEPEGYYPYVKECLGGWKQVVPQPAPSS